MQNPDHAIGRTQRSTSPSVRLARAPAGEKGGANSVEHHTTKGGLGQPSPSERLAMVNSPAERNGTLKTPTVRLAHAVNGQGDPALQAPALLISYFYLEPFLKNQHRYCYRDWVMDSGAFSAHASGKPIDLSAYIEKCKELLKTDPTLTEIFALDVIGDWRASAKNTERMWSEGIPAIPCFHINEPEDVLKCLARDYPKIALGGVAMAKGGVKLKFAEQCFARVWPKKMHGFGFGTENHIMALPWHSVDATNWEIGPCKFGRWQRYGNMSVKGSNQNLRSEVEWYLSLERRARQKWRKEMELLESLAPTIRLAMSGDAKAPVDGGKTPSRLKTLQNPVVRRAAQQHCDAQIARSGLAPTIRLATDAKSGGGKRIDGAITESPTIRLAHKTSGRESKKL